MYFTKEGMHLPNRELYNEYCSDTTNDELFDLLHDACMTFLIAKDTECSEGDRSLAEKNLRIATEYAFYKLTEGKE